MTILFLINNLKSGGTQRHVVSVVEELTRLGYDVRLIIFAAKSEHDLFQCSNVERNLIVIKSSNMLFRIIELAWTMFNINYQLVFNYLESANILGPAITRLKFWKRIYVYNSIRGNQDFNYRGISFWKMLVNGVLTNSKIVETKLGDFYNVSRPKILFVPNGIRLSSTKISINENENIILHVGRITQVKNQKELIEAITLLTHTDNYRAMFVGQIEDKMYYGKLKTLVDQNKITGVEFHKETNNLREYYSKASVLVLSSISEGMPNVILEALSIGLPVISSSVGSVPMLVNEGKNGYLYQPGNPKELASKIVSYFALSKKQRSEMSQNAFSSATKFDLTYTIDIYRNLIDARRNES